MATEDDLAQNAADLALADAALAAPEAELIADPAVAPATAEAGSEAQTTEQPQHEQAASAGILRDLLDERDKRQALERRLRELEAVHTRPAAQPDPFLQPDQFADARIEAALAPIVRTHNIQIAHNNLATARAMHGAELADKAYREFDKALATLHPSEIASVMGAPNPFVAAISWMKRREALAEIGEDIGAYRERLRDELLQDPEFLGRAIEAARSTASGGIPAAGKPRPQAGSSASATTRQTSLPSVNRAGGGTNAALVRRDPSDLELVDEVLNGRESLNR